MCLPVSRLFWVSSLAYPNLLGTKGYVVVVIVVVVVWISEMYVITLWRGWDDDTAVWFNSVRYGVPRNQIRNRSWLIPPIRKLYRITQQSPLSVSITFFFCNRQITGIKDPIAAPHVICFPYHLRFHPWKQTPSKSYSPCII
jgi:hypothetical protein